MAKTQKAMTRTVRQSDLLSAITNPKGKPQDVEAQKKISRFNYSGKVIKTLSDTETAAIKTTVGKQEIYKIKAKRGGKLYNPLTHGEKGLVTVDKVNNDLMFQFKEVNEKAFNSYVKFLQSGYDSFLLAAEREA